MADLAEDAGVSVGAIYRSFCGKAEIISAIILADTGEKFALLKADIDLVRSGEISAERAIERMILQWGSQRSDPLNHEIVAEGHRNPAVADMIAEACGQYRDLFRDLARIAAPDLSDTEIEGAAELLLACLFGVGNREFTRPVLDEAQTAATVARFILQALRRPV